jgi:uncharacterized protein (DUF1015 family)
VFIADGHHRYETALNYFAATRPGEELDTSGPGPDDEQEPSAHVLAFLGAFEDPGMVILPTHRQIVTSGGADWQAYVDALGGRFQITQHSLDSAARAQLRAKLDSAAENVNAFGLVIGGFDRMFYFERPAHVRRNGDSPLEALDVTVLHSTLIGEMLAAANGKDVELAYSADFEAVINAVTTGKFEAAFLMRATRADQLADVCMAGALMPQKSTYFYPKLLTGLVFHTLDR